MVYLVRILYTPDPFSRHNINLGDLGRVCEAVDILSDGLCVSSVLVEDTVWLSIGCQFQFDLFFPGQQDCSIDIDKLTYAPQGKQLPVILVSRNLNDLVARASTPKATQSNADQTFTCQDVDRAYS